MRNTVPFALLLSCIALVGCGQPTASTLAIEDPPAPAETSTLPLFDNLDYANWKRFPVGTMVKRQSVTSSKKATGSTTSVETLTLKELNDREAVVERQNTTHRSDGSYRAVNPPDLRTYPRQFRIPAGMTAQDFSKPARAAKKAGEETLTVQGKSYATTVFTWADQTESGKMNIRVWLSDDMPGRIVKQEMTLPALANTTIDEVIEVKRP